MAEISSKGVNAGKLANNVQKRINRAQEKMMQKLGKADETKDTAFAEAAANFNKQMAESTKLQRDLTAYVEAVKTMHECAKRLQGCLVDIYEPDWFGKEKMDIISQDTDFLWGDFQQQLMDSAIISVDAYMAHFPEIKAEEDLGKAQKVFEEINYDLQEELPSLWKSRVGFYATTFQSVAKLTEKFHREMGRLNHNLCDIMTKLGDQQQTKEVEANSVASECGPDMTGPAFKALADTLVTNGRSDTDLPLGVLYKVKVIHDYAATDNDELDLKSGDIVLVIPFVSPDEQDEGWLLGVKESHWFQNKDLLAKGVFPENFTQRV